MLFKKRISVVFINIFKSTAFMNSNLKIVGFKRSYNFFNKSIQYLTVLWHFLNNMWRMYLLLFLCLKTSIIETIMYLHMQQYM